MGYYEGERKEPCPRCGGVVATLFISVTPMSYYERCRSCAWPGNPPRRVSLADIPIEDDASTHGETVP